MILRVEPGSQTQSDDIVDAIFCYPGVVRPMMRQIITVCVAGFGQRVDAVEALDLGSVAPADEVEHFLRVGDDVLFDLRADRFVFEKPEGGTALDLTLQAPEDVPENRNGSFFIDIPDEHGW